MENKSTNIVVSAKQETSDCTKPRLCAGTKLVSMTDFVLKKAPDFNPLGTDEQANVFDEIVNYAKFLKQTIKLFMFIPCDDNGNKLSYTVGFLDSIEAEEKRLYDEAKKRVIFKDCQYKGEDEENYFIYFPECSKYDNENSTYNYTVVNKNSTLEYYIGFELSDCANLAACT